MSDAKPEDRRFIARMEDRAGKPIAYANFAAVDVSLFEAVISFGLMDPAAAAQQAAGSAGGDVAVEADTVARIALPHKVFVALWEAMGHMIEEHPEMRAAAAMREVEHDG